MDATSTAGEATSDDRLLAGLSHISMFLGVGLLLPLIVWLIQKDKSRYVAFQSLQALFYQLGATILGVVLGCCVTAASFAFIPFSGGSGGGEVVAVIFGVLVFGLFGLVFLVYLIYAMVGAVQAFQGKPFRYPIAGNLAARFTDPDRAGAA